MSWSNKSNNQSKITYVSKATTQNRPILSQNTPSSTKQNQSIDVRNVAPGDIPMIYYSAKKEGSEVVKIKESKFAVFTIGYGASKSTHNFVSALKAHNVRHLVDSRINPYCGYNKDFSSPQIGKVLGSDGIKYYHYLELGNLFKSSRTWNKNWDPYTELLQKSGDVITTRLRKLFEDHPNDNIAILCACGNVETCHRNVISGYLHHEHGYKVVHIK